MKCRLLFVAILCASTRLTAQDNPPFPVQQTSAVADGRFEVVQALLSREYTFRLDRYAGRVWQLINVAADIWQWEETRVIDLAAVPVQNRARFQLHLSAPAGATAILVDTDTGITWQFKKDKSRPRQGWWEVIMER